MEQDIFVFFVNDWKMDNGTTGVTVNYLFLDENGVILPTASGVSGPCGAQRAKVSLPAEERNKFFSIPGQYTGRFNLEVGSDGKPVLKLVEITNFVQSMVVCNKDTYEAGVEALKENKAKVTDNAKATK